MREYTLAEAKYIRKEAGFHLLAATTIENLAQENLKPPLRQLYMAIGASVPATRSSMLIIAQKPATWKLMEHDDAHRKAIAQSVPGIVE